MSSRRNFTPGNKSYAKRMINYNTVYRTIDPNVFNTNNSSQCMCIAPLQYNKGAPDSQAINANISNYRRISQVINNYRGWKPQYGNFYLGEQININYLGYSEGMPGGSGKPPKNSF
jgi:hypothetical protein